jgi:hypothetical protein
MQYLHGLLLMSNDYGRKGALAVWHQRLRGGRAQSHVPDLANLET